MALKFKPEALFKGGAKAAPKKVAKAAKKVLISFIKASSCNCVGHHVPGSLMNAGFVR